MPVPASCTDTEQPLVFTTLMMAVPPSQKVASTELGNGTGGPGMGMGIGMQDAQATNPPTARARTTDGSRRFMGLRISHARLVATARWRHGRSGERGQPRYQDMRMMVPPALAQNTAALSATTSWGHACPVASVRASLPSTRAARTRPSNPVGSSRVQAR